MFVVATSLIFLLSCLPPFVCLPHSSLNEPSKPDVNISLLKIHFMLTYYLLKIQIPSHVQKAPIGTAPAYVSTSFSLSHCVSLNVPQKQNQDLLYRIDSHPLWRLTSLKYAGWVGSQETVENWCSILSPKAICCKSKMSWCPRWNLKVVD